MENKKRTLTPEQLEKMKEGRKRAMEARRKEKDEKAKVEAKLTTEEKREAKRAEKRNKEQQKSKELQKELEALQQQKDRIEGVKKTMDNRNKFKMKVEAIKGIPPPAEEEPDLPFEMDDEEEHHEIIAHDKTEEQEHEELFNEKRDDIIKSVKNPATRAVFNKVTNNYNNKLNITENLNNMVESLRQMIKDNTREIKKTNKVIEKEEVKMPVIEKTHDEMKEEVKYKSQLNSLMRLR